MRCANVRTVAGTLLFAAATVGLSSGGPPADSLPPVEYRQWIQSREESLRSPEGYLALTGLFWLNDGEHTFGSAENNDIVFPHHRGPDRIGTLRVRDDDVTLVAAADAKVTSDGKPVTTVKMLSDADEREPTRFNVGDLTFWLIDRYGIVAIRLRDPQSPILRGYTKTPRFPYSPRWRIEARIESTGPAKISVPTVTGRTAEEDVTGRLHFTIDGKPYTLHATGRSNGELFLIFGDRTNGDQTYRGGRFLRVPVPDNGNATVIDFNRAYNPACAYSPFTTCPLVPSVNALPVPVDAGEKTPQEHR